MAEEVDLSEFEALIPPRKSGNCWMKRATTVLSKGEMRTLQAALEHGYSNRIVAQWLTQRGFSVERSTVGAHRRGECSCVER